jgi:UDP-N-acetylmuramate--alanine ligase
MLAQAGLDPTAVIGGRLDTFGSSARLGKSELMVVEADESDRSFLYLLPAIAVVTNIDREHLDHYLDLEEISCAFVSFMNKVPFYGAVIACADPPWGERLRRLLPSLRRRVVTYGIEPGADVWGTGIELNPKGASFEAGVKEKSLGRFAMQVSGRHNVQNALAAVAVGLELALRPEQIREGLEQFRGVDRRFQVKVEWNGLTVVDDYGHHPTEIRTVVETAKVRGAQHIWAIFQPHRYTRTKFLMDDFARCFDGCERVYVLDIYPASEPPIPGITSKRLVERMRELGFGHAHYAPSERAVIQEILADARPGDFVLTIGAGSVWKVGEALAEELRNRPLSTGDLKA